MFLFPPLLSIMSIWIYSPLLSLLYIVACNFSLGTLGGFLFYLGTSNCIAMNPSAVDACWSQVVTTMILLLVLTLTLLLFQFIAYSFTVRLLRFKQWLVSNSSLRAEPLNFTYFKEDVETAANNEDK